VTTAADAPAPPVAVVRRRTRALPLRYVVNKIISAAVLLLFVTIFNFFLFRVMPGDPGKTFAPRGRNDDPGALIAMRHRMGIGKPLPEQFLLYMKNLFQGQLEFSFSQHEEVSRAIGERVWATVLLSGTALIISVVVGMWLGTRSGWRHGSRFDRIASGSALTWYSVPEWWFGLILIIVFASKSGLGLLPIAGYSDPRSALPHWLDVANHMVLPTIALSVVYIAQYSLIMRSSILDERYAEYLSTARAKGLREDQVMKKHAVPNALLPSVTLFFLSLGFVVSGAILIETVFNWPGLGLLSEQALSGPDYPLLEGVFLVFSAAVIVMNLIADLLYPLIDPRVRAA
jgi:peptide/nickel transport system permease protein